MRVTTMTPHTAGTRLWDIAETYKQYRADLNDTDAFKLAMLSNPELAECYTGCEVRRDAVGEVRKFLVNAS